MTRFFCQELLFDYVSGKLTSERAKEMEEFLQSDDICREDLANLKNAIAYCGKLGLIKTPDSWLERWKSAAGAGKTHFELGDQTCLKALDGIALHRRGRDGGFELDHFQAMESHERERGRDLECVRARIDGVRRDCRRSQRKRSQKTRSGRDCDSPV